MMNLFVRYVHTTNIYPHFELNIPLESNSSYKNDYHKHLLHVWNKLKDDNPW
jgi:hypothetical protein